jgi:hypothetical protein
MAQKPSAPRRPLSALAIVKRQPHRRRADAPRVSRPHAWSRPASSSARLQEHAGTPLADAGRSCNRGPVLAHELVGHLRPELTITPISLPLVVSPRCERARPRLGATAIVLAPAWAGLSQWRQSGRPGRTRPASRPAIAFALYERGPVSSPSVLRRGVCLREVVARWHGCRRSPGRMGVLASLTGRGWGSGLERCSSLYRFINFEDQV